MLSVDRPRLRLRARAEASLLRRIDKELLSTALSRSLALLLVYCKLFNVLMPPAPFRAAAGAVAPRKRMQSYGDFLTYANFSQPPIFMLYNIFFATRDHTNTYTHKKVLNFNTI